MYLMIEYTTKIGLYSDASVGKQFLFISGTRLVTLTKKSMLRHERGNEDEIVCTTDGACPWSFVSQIFCIG